METSLVRCAIVDDDAVFLRTLRGFVQRACEEMGVECRIDAFGDPYDLIEDYEPRFDVVFLDIEMPGINGMDLAHKIREQDEGASIIFVTNMAQFALKGYEVNATDFIVKPVTYETFSAKLQRALRFVERHRRKAIVFQDAERHVRVDCADISCVEKRKNYAVFHTGQGDFMRRMTIGEVLGELGQTSFVQVNSGIVVNLAAVDTYTSTEIVLQDGRTVSLSRSRRASFIAALMDYLGG